MGVESLREVAQQLYVDRPQAQRPKDCFVVIVDAYAEGWNLFRSDSDTRKAIDFVVDTNALEASSVLLSLRRREILRAMGVEFDPETGPTVYKEFHLFSGTDERVKKNPDLENVKCRAWLITFQRLAYVKEISHAPAIGAIVNNIPTRYTLLAPHGLRAQNAQDALFEAAEILIRKDTETLKKVCSDLRENLKDIKCPH